MGLLFAWAMIALAVPVFPRGDGAPGIVWLIVAGAIATYLQEWLPTPTTQQLELAVWTTTLIAVAVGLVWVPIMATRQPPVATNPAAVIAPLAVVLVAVLAQAAPIRAHTSVLVANVIMGLAVAAVVVAGGAYILGVPDPKIDVFYFLNEGARGLLNGHNPYAMSFTGLPNDNPGYADPAYHFDVYSYLPGMLLLSLLSVPLGDVRWLMLASLPVSAFFLRQTLRHWGARAQLADLSTLAFVSYPGWLWVIREAWTEPLIVCALFIALWAAICRRLYWAIAAAAVFLSIKQYTPLLLLPLWSALLTVRRLMVAVVLTIPASGNRRAGGGYDAYAACSLAHRTPDLGRGGARRSWPGRLSAGGAWARALALLRAVARHDLAQVGW